MVLIRRELRRTAWRESRLMAVSQGVDDDAPSRELSVPACFGSRLYIRAYAASTWFVSFSCSTLRPMSHMKPSSSRAMAVATFWGAFPRPTSRR